MSHSRVIAEAFKPLVDLVYPPRCPLCGDAVADQGGVCADCFMGIEPPGEPSCSACMRPIGGAAGQDALCFVCASEPPRHGGIYAATLYGDESRKLILTFKHGGKIALAGLLARMIAQRLPTGDGDEAPLLVPVPLHRWRLWNRGYNQAALLAGELEKLGQGELVVDALIRQKRTPSLGGLGRSARERALSGAISVRARRASRIAGRHIILVDDVLTSGATSDACVDALLGAGAASVKIACFARVVDGGGDQSVAVRKLHTRTPEAVTAPGAT